MKIRDQAEAARHYVKAAKMTTAMANRCAEIRIRAERKAGEMIRANPQIRQGGDRKSKYHDDTLKLDDLGISKLQ